MVLALRLCRLSPVLSLLPVLAGCAVSPHAFNPPVLVSQTGQPGAYTLTRGAVPGRPQKVSFLAVVNPDCSSSGYNTLRTRTPPSHGVVEFVQTNDFGTWSPGNPRAKCGDRRVPGMAIVYTSEAGFRGTDEFTVTDLTPDGFRHVLNYRVVVE